MKKKPIQNSGGSFLLRKVSRVIKLCLAIMLVTTIQVFASANASVESVGISEGSASQQAGKKITGKVTDANGAALPGVSIVVKGTTIGVISDMDGN